MNKFFLKMAYIKIKQELEKDPIWKDKDIAPFITNIMTKDINDVNHQSREKTRHSGCVSRRIYRTELKETPHVQFNMSHKHCVCINVMTKPPVTADGFLTLLHAVRGSKEDLQDFEDSICCPILYNRTSFYKTLKDKFKNFDKTDMYNKIMKHMLLSERVFITGKQLADLAPGYINTEEAMKMINNLDQLYESDMCINCIYFTMCLLIYETTPLTAFKLSILNNVNFMSGYLANYSDASFKAYTVLKDDKLLYLLSLLISENASWYKEFITKYENNRIMPNFINVCDEDFMNISYINYRNNFMCLRQTYAMLTSDKNPEDCLELEKTFNTVGGRFPSDLYSSVIKCAHRTMFMREIDIDKFHKQYMTNDGFCYLEVKFAHIIHTACLKYRINIMQHISHI